MRTICFLLLIVIVCFLWTTAAFPMGYEGNFEIVPYLSVREARTDNVFDTPNDPRSDTITTYTPGISLKVPFKVNRVAFDYHAVLMRYHTFTTEKTNDHNASGHVDLEFGSRISLNLKDEYRKEHESRSESVTGFIEKFRNNTGAASLVYQMADRSKVQVDYSRSSWTFITSSFRDRGEDAVDGYLFYRFLPKTSAFVQYERKTVDFTQAVSNPLDNDVDSALVGITWNATNRSHGTIKFGRSWKDFSNPGVPDYRTWTESLDVQHQFTSYTSLVLLGQRTINESNYIGVRLYTSTGIYGELTHKFGFRLAGVVHGIYDVDQYSDASVDAVSGQTVVRKDTNKSIGGGCKYSIMDRLDANLDYTLRTRDSNVAVGNYREHVYAVTLSTAL